MRRARWWVAACAGLALGVPGCGDGGPDSGPGALTATVTSPNGAEGAARVTLMGPGIGAVTALQGRAFSHAVGDTVQVVVVNPEGGDLVFSVAVADTTQPPQAVLVEVAGPDDQIRALTGYSVEVRR